jgi:hypothetical protein
VPERAVGGTSAVQPSQVFVDDSGRRSRWMRLAGYAVTTLCAGYIGIVAVGLSQTQVGPLLDVPVGGNGLIAGFPNTSGIVPGLLASGGSARLPAHTATRQPAGRARPVRKQVISTPPKPPKPPKAGSTPAATLKTRATRSTAEHTGVT